MSNTAETEAKEDQYVPVKDELGYDIVNGIHVPKFVTPRNLRAIKAHVPSDEDVFVVTYPKCGTTWMQNIIRWIRACHSGDFTDTKERLDVAVPWITRYGEGFASHPDITGLTVSPRVYKTHLSLDLNFVPHSSACKFIYVARNPKDQAVSLFFHTERKDRGANTYNGTCDDYVRDWWLEGKAQFGDYFHHLAGAVAAATTAGDGKAATTTVNNSNLLFVTYEEMSADLAGQVRRISGFLNLPLTDEQVARVTQECTFSTMSRNNTSNYSWGGKRDGKTNFMRKGQVGSWQETLSDEMSAAIDERYAACLSTLSAEGRALLAATMPTTENHALFQQ